MASKGSRTYIYKADPKTGKSRPEQDIVEEKILGKKLGAGQQVDHKNSNPHDNRPSNLRVLPSAVNESLGGKNGAAKTNARRGRNKKEGKG